jgi:hypothetical protein
MSLIFYQLLNYSKPLTGKQVVIPDLIGNPVLSGCPLLSADRQVRGYDIPGKYFVISS